MVIIVAKVQRLGPHHEQTRALVGSTRRSIPAPDPTPIRNAPRRRNRRRKDQRDDEDAGDRQDRPLRLRHRPGAFA